MSFKDIRGQDNALSFLKGAAEHERIHHAYIFLGPAGVGKKMAALNFAKMLNCEGDISARPCDECVPCRKIDSSNHPDIFLLRPEKEGASIKIDPVRRMMNDIALKPYEGRRKVYIIDDAVSLTQEAIAAILKTLEEPPADSVLILIVENIKSVPKTIISRAQVVRFHPLRVEEVENVLVDKYKLDDAKAKILARASSGRPGEAVRFMNEDFFEKRNGVINGLLKKTFFDSDFKKTQKEDFRLYLDIMLTWYRDILVTKAGLRPSSNLINADKADVISGEAKRVDFDYLENVIDQIVLTGNFLEQNANPKLAFGVLGLKIDG